MKPAILEVKNFAVHFPIANRGLPFRTSTTLKAVDGVSFDVREGETLGIVGESGCGKSTLARGILQLIPSTSGEVMWRGSDLRTLDSKNLRTVRKEIQIIFQDPFASLDPRMTIGEIIAEPLRIHHARMTKADRRNAVTAIMADVGLLPEQINRYPHEFSGGQAQRIGIARAMILRPKLIVCDEPVSALDVSVQAQIINLLMALQSRFRLSLIFISHDLGVVRHVSHRTMVLYLGKVMEIAHCEDIYARSRHPYTRSLISAIPIPDPDLQRARLATILEGDPPSPLASRSGCLFRSRCRHSVDICATETPPLELVSEGHQVACFRWREIQPD